MERIINELSKIRFSDSDTLKPESFLLRLKYYYEQNNRHKYSEISKIVYGFKDDSIDILRINLVEIKRLAHEGEYLDIREKIEKLIDHANLAEYQRKLIEDVGKEQKILIKGYQSVIESTKKQLSSVKKEVENEIKELEKTEEKLNIVRQELKDTEEKVEFSYRQIDNEIDKLKEETSRVYTQFVTILGIFTAIIIGVFGGIEIIGNVMNNINSVEVSKLIMFSSLLMAAIITILYLLLVSLSNLTGKPIRSCGCNNDVKCEHNLLRKHPIYIISMISSLYLFIVGTLAYGFGIKNLKGIQYIDDLMSRGSNLAIISILLLIVFLLALRHTFKKNN